MGLTPSEASPQVAHPHSLRTGKKRKRRPFPLHQRRKDLARLVVWRHHRLRLNGWTYIKVAAEHCLYGPKRRDALMLWLEHVCAPIPTRRQADDILDRIPPCRWTADDLGRHLRVTDHERATLRTYTIGSYQTPKAERIRQRKQKDRRDAQARRRDNGSKPREQSLSRTKPWEAEGVSRRTWYRRHPVAQIRRQEASLPLTTADESVPPSSTRNRNGKSNGKHGPQRRKKVHRGEHPPPATAVHDLMAIGVG